MDFQYFLILLFVFWVLEGLAKAKKRGQAEQQERESGGLEELPPPGHREEPRMRRPPELPDEAAEPRGRPVPQAKPRTLWEEIQEIARQQQEQDRSQRQRPAPAEASPAPEEGGGERAAAARVEVLSTGEEHLSDRWSGGARRELERVPSIPARRPRASLRERHAEPAARAAAVHAHSRALDPLALPRLSRHELRRLLVLQEVLGPPVALRDEPPGQGG